MLPSPLTETEFQQVLRVAQRVLINDREAAVDIQDFLVARLGEDSPQAAAKIAGFDAAAIGALWRAVSAAIPAEPSIPVEMA